MEPIQPVDDVKDTIFLASTPLPIVGGGKRRLLPKAILNLKTAYIHCLSLAHLVGPVWVLVKHSLQETTTLAVSVVQLPGLVNNFQPMSSCNAIILLSIMKHLYAP